MAFATPEDLEARWRMLSDSEKGRAEALLEDAAAMLHAEFAAVGKEIDETDELQKVNLKVISCSMVKRVMASGQGADITQTSMTAGSFSEQFTYANPTGDMYLTANERRILGVPKRRGHVQTVAPYDREAIRW